MTRNGSVSVCFMKGYYKYGIIRMTLAHMNKSIVSTSTVQNLTNAQN